MSHQAAQIYEFGSYRLDVAEHVLSRNGEAIPLQPKAFDLLLLLVERHGHLLEKDELMAAICPDTVVEEVNLANNISILRKTLSDGGQQFIETVPRDIIWRIRLDGWFIFFLLTRVTQRFARLIRGEATRNVAVKAFEKLRDSSGKGQRAWKEYEREKTYSYQLSYYSLFLVDQR